MRMKPHFRAATVALLLSALAGCGQGTFPSGTLGENSETTRAWRQGGGERDGEFAPSRERMGGPWGMLDLEALELSAEQREALRAIAEKYRPAPPSGEHGAPSEAVIPAILRAEPLDVEALRAALASPPPAPMDMHPLGIDAMVEAYGVLTDAQRSELVARLQALPVPADDERQPPSPAEHLERLAAGLDLNAEQTLALEAFKSKLDGAPQRTMGGEVYREGVIALLETGDPALLLALKPTLSERPAFPIEEFVALAEVLSATQRQVLLVDDRRGPGGPHEPHRFGGPRR